MSQHNFWDFASNVSHDTSNIINDMNPFNQIATTAKWIVGIIIFLIIAIMIWIYLIKKENAVGRPKTVFGVPIIPKLRY